MDRMTPAQVVAPAAAKLSLLVVDDSDDDAFFVCRKVRAAGYEVTHLRVDTAAALRQALTTGSFDVVVCDYHIPGFGAAPALEILRELAIDLPVIVVSGVIGEEAAADCMRAGAHDFVLKDNLSRLVPAIERERAEHAVRRERAEMRERLALSEGMLVRAEKLRALGEMASGIAHDLVNLLHPLSLHLTMLDRALVKGDTQTATEAAKEMRVIVDRGVGTVERLRDFGKDANSTPTGLLQLDVIVREAVDLARPRMIAKGRARHRVTCELGNPPPIQGHAADIFAAIVNLLANAADAMPKAGTVKVATGTTTGRAFVTVIDDGPGIPSDVAKRVFEPFFTTKGEQGTGLGLAMVASCMKRHGGEVKLASVPGQGAAFTLSFPTEASAAL
jgi:signal transduction histidine kinase